MSQIEVGKTWEGRVVAGKFPLLQWLGGSDHSAVFLTERSGNGPQKAAIKLVPVEMFSSGNLDEAAQLSRWSESAKVSHPNLIQLFENGRAEIDGSKFVYVVMEYAEENLGQIIPQRPLTPEEVQEMLRPTAEVLGYLHKAGFAHSRIRPSNILAVDNQLKVSAESLRKPGEADKHAGRGYDAPELAGTGPSPAADVWALGATIVASLTQRESDGEGGSVPSPETIPQPLRKVAEGCLRRDPKQRYTIEEILGKPRPREVPAAKPLPVQAEPLTRNSKAQTSPSVRQSQTQSSHSVGLQAVSETSASSAAAKRSRVWIIVAGVAAIVAVILLAVWVGKRSSQPGSGPAEVHPAETSGAANTAESRSVAAPSANATATSRAGAKGRVRKEISPEVSAGARRTMTGRLKVSIAVSVDSAGNVTQAELVSAGPSKYFARQAMAAAQQWKFDPPQVNGQPSASEWTLRFQFGRTSTEVVPEETKP